jgi:hypothetical protein
MTYVATARSEAVLVVRMFEGASTIVLARAGLASPAQKLSLLNALSLDLHP